MNVVDHVACGSFRHPDRPALRFEETTTTYAELEDQASRVARRLASMGIGVGDRVGLFLPNCAEFVVGYVAILRVGAIAVSFNAHWKRLEVEAAVADSQPRVVITDDERAGYVGVAGGPVLLRREELRSLPPVTDDGLVAPIDLAPHTPAVIVYSSGTTGQAKGCTLSHGNVVSNIEAKVDYLGIRGDDRLLLFVPLYHCFGQNAVLNAGLQAGATIVLEPAFSLGRLPEIVRAEAPTMFFGAPPVYIALLEHLAPGDLGSIRYYFSAAAAMSPSVAIRFQEIFGHVVHVGYGLTETSPFATYNHCTRYRLGSVGTPIRDVQIRIVDPDSGAERSTDEVGEIVIRGPNVMLGYWCRAEETAEVIRAGWLHTGDLGRLDRDGYLYVVDRLKDMINVGGVKVYPTEVEERLLAHPEVARATVLSVPDATLGERVAAAVVLAEGSRVTPEQLIAFLRERIADFKVPSVLEIRSELPVSPTGKVLRGRLRAQLGRAGITKSTG
ncbi:MAG: class I adenylate-forming enzyme family protein [Pseudonocardiaceae bacterium]